MDHILFNFLITDSLKAISGEFIDIEIKNILKGILMKRMVRKKLLLALNPELKKVHSIWQYNAILPSTAKKLELQKAFINCIKITTFQPNNVT